jgi:2-methylcitrate dehydratase PrpD
VIGLLRVTDGAGLARPAVDPGSILAVAAVAPGEMNLVRVLGHGPRLVARQAACLRSMVRGVAGHAFDARSAHRAPGMAGGAWKPGLGMEPMIERARLVSDHAAWRAGST